MMVRDSHVRDNCLLLSALDYAGRGWHVIYVSPRAKNPVPDDWQHIATTDPVIERWWSDGKPYNIGVQLGPRSGIIDVECDSPEAEQALAALLGESAPVVPTFQGKRGKHRLFLYTPNLPRQGRLSLPQHRVPHGQRRQGRAEFVLAGRSSRRACLPLARSPRRRRSRVVSRRRLGDRSQGIRRTRGTRCTPRQRGHPGGGAQ
jgi:hypothetical protein